VHDGLAELGIVYTLGQAIGGHWRRHGGHPYAYARAKRID
jgi:hypothetical protein